MSNQDGGDSDDTQIDGTEQSDLVQNLLDELTGGLAGTEAGDVSAVILQVVCNLYGIELNSGIEVSEEDDQQEVDNCVGNGVVAEEGADKARIEKEIKEMPNYFADYDTTVHFISLEELKRDHSSIPHGGFVIRSGKTGFDLENNHIIEYSLKLDSNPEFTASVIVAFARAAHRMYKEGFKGCKTVFDIPPAYLSSEPYEELIKHLL